MKRRHGEGRGARRQPRRSDFPGTGSSQADSIEGMVRAVEAMSAGNFVVALPASGGGRLERLSAATGVLGRKLETYTRKLEMLHSLLTDINEASRPDDLFDRLFEVLDTWIPYDRIGFALYDPDEGLVRSSWNRSRSKMKLAEGHSTHISQTSLGQILESRAPRILNDLPAYLQEHPGSRATRLLVEEGARSNLTCPLIRRDQVLGFIFFSSTRPGAYLDSHIDFFHTIGGYLATIVMKSKIHEDLVHLNEFRMRFLGIAAHDLRSPIGVVIGYVQALLGGLMDLDQATLAGVLGRIDRRCHTMLDLIDNLLDISLIDQGRMSMEPCRCDLAAILQRVVEEMALVARAKSIEIDLLLEPDLPAVRGDPMRLEQVLTNLLTNAFKFSHKGTTVTLSASTQGDFVTISITDRGLGIPAIELPVLFDGAGGTSVRPTGPEKSSGLGLAISKAIVEAHGGRIWAESVQGSGSSFHFTLPVGTSEPTAEFPPPARGSRPAFSHAPPRPRAPG